MKELLERYDDIFNKIMQLEKQLWNTPTYNIN